MLQVTRGGYSGLISLMGMYVDAHEGIQGDEMRGYSEERARGGEDGKGSVGDDSCDADFVAARGRRVGDLAREDATGPFRGQRPRTKAKRNGGVTAHWLPGLSDWWIMNH